MYTTQSLLKSFPCKWVRGRVFAFSAHRAQHLARHFEQALLVFVQTQQFFPFLVTNQSFSLSKQESSTFPSWWKVLIGTHKHSLPLLLKWGSPAPRGRLHLIPKCPIIPIIFSQSTLSKNVSSWRSKSWRSLAHFYFNHSELRKIAELLAKISSL